MALPEKLFLSDLLRHRVRCDQGIDHGQGVMPWMHPPVHRLLGWISTPSVLKLSRKVWRLNQLKGMGHQQAFVKGLPSDSDQGTLDRLPTLMDADLISKNGNRLGVIADLVFEPLKGKILYYLVSRSNPKIPGTSRWRLDLNHITDQQPGMVSTDLKELDEIPIARSSIRQNFLKNSRLWRDQIQVISDKASSRLEGWLEEPTLEEKDIPINKNQKNKYDPLDDWDDDFFYDQTSQSNQFDKNWSERQKKTVDNEEDPWI